MGDLPLPLPQAAATVFLKIMSSIENSIKTANELETELRKTAGSVKVRTVDEMESKLLQLAEVASYLGESLVKISIQNELTADYLEEVE